jgi:hypothetical protein
MIEKVTFRRTFLQCGFAFRRGIINFTYTRGGEGGGRRSAGGGGGRGGRDDRRRRESHLFGGRIGEPSHTGKQ